MRRALARLALAAFAAQLAMVAPFGVAATRAAEGAPAHAAMAMMPGGAASAVPVPTPCHDPGGCPFGLMVCGPGASCLALSALPAAAADLVTSPAHAVTGGDPAPAALTTLPSLGTPPPRA